MNREWLHGRDKEGEVVQDENISAGYLDWNAYGDESNQRPEAILPLDDRMLTSCKALSEADVLLAADVAYDSSVIGCLAKTVRTFLTVDSSGGPKQVLFAKNLRNKQTTNLLLSLIPL